MAMKKNKIKRDISKLEKIIRLLFIAAAVILFWRGIWGLADVLILPENYLYSSIISIILGIIILALAHENFRDLL